MTSHQETVALQQRLQEVLGPEPTATLMSMIGARDDLVTKSDLLEFGDALRADLRGEMSTLREELKGEMSALREELKGEMSALRDELKGEMSALRTELRTEIADQRGEFSRELRGFVRTFVFAQVTTVIGVAGIVLGITQLL